MVNRRLVRMKVLQALYAHMSAYADIEGSTAGEANRLFSLGDVGRPDQSARLELERSLQAYCDLQHAIMLLMLELRKASMKRVHLAHTRYLRSGVEPSENFVKNRVLQQYALNESLRAYRKRHNVGWVGHEDFVWRLFQALEKESFFDSYLALRAPTYEDDRAVVVGIYDWLQDVEIPQLADGQLDESRTLYAWALSGTLFYYADLDSVLLDLQGVAQSQREDDGPDAALLPSAVDEEFRAFAVDLLSKSIEQQANNLQTIIPFLRNWDPSRVAFMDLLVLLMGLAEALNFPEIPVPVTINEYIELARLFSTDASPQFVNGVLDTMFKHLVDEGVIVKRARPQRAARVRREP